jgi:hypothetical protein
MPRADKKKSFPTFCPFLLSMDYRIYDLIYIENKQWFKCFVTQLRDTRARGMARIPVLWQWLVKETFERSCGKEGRPSLKVSSRCSR